MISATTTNNPNFVQRIARDHSALVITLVLIFMAVCIIGAATAPNFLTLFNFKTIIRDAAIVGIMAIGLAFATCMAAGLGFPMSFLITMAIATVAGAVQGLLIGLGGNPIVVTLGAAGLFFGIGSWWSDNLVVSFRRPHGAEWLGTGSTFGLPNITIAFVIIAVVAELVLRKTSFGRQVYLIGANRAAGRATGHENFAMAIKVCIIASVCSAFVAVAFSAQVSSAHVNYFSSEFGSSGDMTIMVIATVMVGGNSIMGGYGSTLRSSLGAVFISTVDNMMVLHGFNSGPRVLAVGLMIVFSIMVFALVRRGSRAEE